jgi:peptidoglycan hydrolase-like protein with peptidoglycan-binding domain
MSNFWRRAVMGVAAILTAATTATVTVATAGAAPATTTGSPPRAPAVRAVPAVPDRGHDSAGPRRPALSADDPYVRWPMLSTGAPYRGLVAAAQCLLDLKKSTPHLPCDWKFQDPMQKSVRYFQQKAGLPQTGAVGKATWHALISGVWIQEGNTGPAVKALQNLLNDYGYGIKVDGKFGSGTYKAVKTFQSLQAIPVTGAVGDQTWPALLTNDPKYMPND